jgi:predicted metalloprotease with PDZ domain
VKPITSSIKKTIPESPALRKATPGLDLRLVDGHALVTFVAPDSPAAAKGVKLGWEILRIDGKELAPGMAKVRAALGSPMLAELIETRSV